MALDTTTEPIITITPDALAKVLELRTAEDEPETLGLHIEVTGMRGSDYLYDLAFEPVSDALPEDAIRDQGGLPIIIPAESIDRLQGATLDLPSNPNQGGLVLRNPNRPDVPQLGDTVELTGTPEEKVRQLLDTQVNPAIAVHGGYTSLVKVEDGRAHITMGGGCQGCALSAMTLREGIETAILSNVPEVTEVVDVTDHTAGENPFYE